MTSILSEKLLNLPNRPGVYMFKNVLGKIIYVGKAKNLKNRVGSYFHINLEEESKTAALVARINDLELIEVESEFDALILEAELIKKYRPKYNIIQKDDKTYLYIVIRKEIVYLQNNTRKIQVAKILTARKTEILPNDVKFGPYPDGSTAKFVVKTLRKLFPFRDCSSSKFSNYHRQQKPCLFGHLGICPAPCVNFTDKDLTEYSKNIQSVKRILQGGSFKVLSELNKKMAKFSKDENYEMAAQYRDLVTKYNYVRQKSKMPEVYMENPTFIEDQASLSLKRLQEVLPFLTNLPTRIECYDISNISGTEAVGSMVVATEGKIDKKEYKRFRIKFKQTPDDFEMLREVLFRRISHHSKVAEKKLVWPDPHLLVIDGGKGQVSAVLSVLEKMPIWSLLNIHVVGLAKKYETIVYKSDDAFVELSLDKNDSALALLIRLRDEAHRFAQDYHHKLRSKKLLV